MPKYLLDTSAGGLVIAMDLFSITRSTSARLEMRKWIQNSEAKFRLSWTNGLFFNYFFLIFTISASISAILTGPIVSEVFHEKIHAKMDVILLSFFIHFFKQKKGTQKNKNTPMFQGGQNFDSEF